MHHHFTNADWWMVYGPITALSVFLARYGLKEPRSEETLGAAFVLASEWVIWNTCHWWMPHPYNQIFPATDAFVCAILTLVWRNRLSPWRLVILSCLLVDCVLHAVYFNTTLLTKTGYDTDQNITYLISLFAVSHCGIRRVYQKMKSWQKPATTRAYVG